MADVIELRNDRLAVGLLPEIGGSIGRFDYLGDSGSIPILRPGDRPASPLDAACFPLVPYCNRIRGGHFVFRGRTVELRPNMAGDASPLHGQGWLAAWTVDKWTERHATLSFLHEPGQWPWRYHAVQRFDLDEHGLTSELVCTNAGTEPMPCGLGFHPYFPCSSGTWLATHVETVWTVDANVLPVANIPAAGEYDLSGGPICGRGLDNGYGGWGGEARIEQPSVPFAVRLSSPPAGFFQLYSPRSGGIFVAEPVSHANAALNAAEADWPSLGMRVLAPGEAMAMIMRLEIELR